MKYVIYLLIVYGNRKINFHIARVPMNDGNKKMDSEVMKMNITSSNYDEEVIKSDKPVLLDFWSEGCMPCKMFASVLEQFEKEHPEIKVGKVNVNDEMSLAQKYNIEFVPTIVLIKNGQVISTEVGFHEKGQLEELCK